jgi:hypothetical protein
VELDDIIAIYKSFKSRRPNKLKALLKAKHFFNLAVDEDSSSAYSEVFQYAEKALKYSSADAEMHYIARVSRLRAFGDRDYALRKCDLLMTIGPEGIKWSKVLKDEIWK